MLVMIIFTEANFKNKAGMDKALAASGAELLLLGKETGSCACREAGATEANMYRGWSAHHPSMH